MCTRQPCRGCLPVPARCRLKCIYRSTAPQTPTPAERKLGGTVLVDLNGEPAGMTAGRQSAAAAPAAGDGVALASTGEKGESSIGSRLQPTILSARSAGKLPNLDYLLKRGMSIPCALQTGIDTTLPGFVVCVTTSDVYSANGTTLLIARGSTQRRTIE